MKRTLSIHQRSLGLALALGLAILGPGTRLLGNADSGDCPIPTIQKQSKNGIAIYQGDRLQLSVEACGQSLSYEWAFFDPTQAKAEYQSLACTAASCAIQTAALPEGTYDVHVAVSNAEGAAFTILSFRILDRPAKAMAARTIEPDAVPASQATQAALPALQGKIHNNSAYGRGIQHLSQGETIAAKTQLIYSLWNEAQYRDQAKAALSEVQRIERWTGTFNFGFLQDSNFLRQGSNSEAAAGQEEHPRARLAYRLAPTLSVKAYRSDRHETSFYAGMNREGNFEFLKLYGFNVGGDGKLNAYDQTRFDVGARQTYSNSAHWDQASLLLTAEASASQLKMGSSTSDNAIGFKVDLGSPVLRGSPIVSLLLAKHQDANTAEATPFDPVTGEVHPWPNHSGQRQQLGLDLTLWRQHSSQIKGIWQHETWKHTAADAKIGDYNALRFSMVGQFRIGLKQAVSAKLGYEGRLHPEAADARLDRRTTVSGSWSWYIYPYLYRSITVSSESNQSNRSRAQYQRLILMASGTVEI